MLYQEDGMASEEDPIPKTWFSCLFRQICGSDSCLLDQILGSRREGLAFAA